MGIIVDSCFPECLLVLVLVLYLAYRYITRNNNYWDKRGVDNSKRAILFTAMIGKKSILESFLELYHQFSEKRFGGFFQASKPMLMICDAEMIQNILVRDFTHFQNRAQPQFKNDILSKNLIGLRGQKWRATRRKLAPTFSSGKLKSMFEQVSKSGDILMEKIVQMPNKNCHIDSKPFFFQFTLDVIASCAFGIQFDSTISTEAKKFKSIIQYMIGFPFSKILKYVIVSIIPKLEDILKITSLPSELEKYAVNLVKSTLKFRKDNIVLRNDYFQLLLTLKEEEESGKNMGVTPETNKDFAEDNQIQQHTEPNLQSSNHEIKLFTEEAIVGHSLIFFTAGAESSSITVTFLLFELTKHPDIQQRVQQEVDSALAKHSGLTYEAVKDMTYLDQVIQESLRLYPVLPVMLRECVQTYKVPGSDMVIEKGVVICISVIGLHMDSRYYPDPEQFDPDRFIGNNFKPSPTFLPFGDGPRICIGLKFAVMQLKICIAKIMSKYSVKLSDNTSLPLKINRRLFVPDVDGGIWLRFENRKTSQC